MCRVFEEVRDEGLKRGRKEGLNEKATEVAKSLIQMGLLSFEQISQATKLPIEKIKELAEA